MIRSSLVALLTMDALLGTAKAQKQFDDGNVIKITRQDTGLLFPLLTAVEDLDEDGVKDLLTIEGFLQINGSGRIVMLSRAHSVKRLEKIPLLATAFIYAKTYVPLDINGDLLPDLIGVSGGAKVYLLENQGHDSPYGKKFKIGKKPFSLAMEANITMGEYQVWRREAIDIDNDGRKEVILCGGPPRNWLWPTVTGNLSIVTSEPKEISLDPWDTMFYFDVAKEKGKVYILAIDSQNNMFTFFQTEGFKFWYNKWSPTITGITSYSLGDIDGDKDLDLVLTDIKGNIWLKESGGKMNFSPAKKIATEEEVGKTLDQVETLDVNGDGRTDILALTTDKEKSEVIYLENIGNKRFGIEKINTGYSHEGTLEGFSRVMRIADMDGNGSPDLIIGPLQNKSEGVVTVIIKNKDNYGSGQILFGKGTPSSNPPRILHKGKLELGGKVRLILTGAKPGSKAALHLGPVVANWPMLPWLDIQVFPVKYYFHTSIGRWGMASVLVDVPKDKILLGLRTFWQWISTGRKTPLEASKALLIWVR